MYTDVTMEQATFSFKYLVLELYKWIVKYVFLEFTVNLIMFLFGGEDCNRYCKVNILFFIS